MEWDQPEVFNPLMPGGNETSYLKPACFYVEILPWKVYIHLHILIYCKINYVAEESGFLQSIS